MDRVRESVSGAGPGRICCGDLGPAEQDPAVGALPISIHMSSTCTHRFKDSPEAHPQSPAYRDQANDPDPELRGSCCWAGSPHEKS